MPSRARWNDDSRSIFRFPRLPEFGPRAKEFGVYLSGGLFTAGWWLFVDGIILASKVEQSHVTIGFEDWIAGVLTTLGLIVINLIDNSRMQSDLQSGSRVEWVARLFLFVGFALMAGGLAGSISVLVLKYVVPEVGMPEIYFGYTIVGQAMLIMLSTVVLWIAQNTEPEYQYNFVL
jgi:hypothetical protein